MIKAEDFTTGDDWTRPPWLITQREDGDFQIGLDDSGPGPFRTRHFAEAVAAEAESYVGTT